MWGDAYCAQAIGMFWAVDTETGLVAALGTLELSAEPLLKISYEAASRRGILFPSATPFGEFVFDELVARSATRKLLNVNDGRLALSACQELAPFAKSMADAICATHGLNDFFGELHKCRAQAFCHIVCVDIGGDDKPRLCWVYGRGVGTKQTALWPYGMCPRGIPQGATLDIFGRGGHCGVVLCGCVG